MGIVAIVLLALALLAVLAAEWPRIVRGLGAEQPSRRPRAKQKQRLTVVHGGLAEGDDADDFAKSVERDLANLPVIEPRDRS